MSADKRIISAGALLHLPEGRSHVRIVQSIATVTSHRLSGLKVCVKNRQTMTVIIFYHQQLVSHPAWPTMSLTLPRWPENFLTTRLVSVSTTRILKSSSANPSIPLKGRRWSCQAAITAFWARQYRERARVRSTPFPLCSPLSVQRHPCSCSIQLQLLF